MKMGKEIYELLLAYLREDISEKEMIRLQGWLAENERHRKLMEELRIKKFYGGKSERMLRLILLDVGVS